MKGEGAGRGDEDQSIQELYRGFQSIEKRLESLETILIDSHRKGGIA